MKNFCCKEFENFFFYMEDAKKICNIYIIYGNPIDYNKEDSGVREYEISFCPFCGKKLNKGE